MLKQFFSILIFYNLILISFGKKSKIVNDNYLVEWEIIGKDITFQITVKTNGFIGFGISRNGGMKDADIFTGGVYPNGSSYSNDRYGYVKNSYPELDKQQDWFLIDSFENSTHTYLNVIRKLNTCDDEDIPITNQTLRFIWSFGSSDEIVYHGSNRGTFSENLIYEKIRPDLSIYSTWNATTQFLMPPKDTTYWCTLHKAPKLDAKHHIVAFDVLLEGLAETHTHHVDFYRCVTPKGENSSFFEKYLNRTGFECFDEKSPRQYCELFEISWSIGGLIIILPNDVGIPLPGSEDVYYLMETHYDNPQELSGIEINSGLQIYYTQDLRKYDAGFLSLAYRGDKPFSILIPPNSTNFTIPAHGSNQCTKHIPNEGIKIFNVFLHSHLSGRKMKIRVFRNETELPWLANDPYYDFTTKGTVELQEEFTLLTNDHMTLECEYDTTWRNGKVTYGGLSTREEMCTTFLLYYPRMENEIESMRSFHPSEKILKYFEIDSATDDEDPTVILPEKWKGKKLSEIIESIIDWSFDKRLEFQNFMNGTQNGTCEPKYKDIFVNTTYPSIHPIYEPPPCIN